MKKIDYNVVQRMTRLSDFYGTYRSKCRRNLRLYEYSPTISLDNLTDDQVVGYYQQGFFDVEEDTTSSIQENVIRECIDYLTSKIASHKIRPFINTVNGTFREMQVAKQAQDYFDSVYDEQNVNKTVSNAWRDACVFDKGIIYIDRDNKSISRVMPWQVFIDPREASYGRITQIAWKQEQYPKSLLPLKSNDDSETVTYWQYWDLNKRKKYYYIPEMQYFEEEKWECNCIPFVYLNYSSPVKATSAQSIVDLLYGIQMEIDAIMVKIKDASQLVPIQTFFVPEGSTIKVDKLSNRTGEIITYTATPNMTGSPVTSSTTPFMDPQWIQTVETLKQHAYQSIGISPEAIQSRKQAGLNSGVALSTMEDIQSERFQTQLNTIIRAYVDIARIMIQVFDAEEDILPPNRFRSTIHWSDIVEMRDMMTIQFSAADSLSKDPSTKLQQLQALYAAGLIPQSRIAQLLDLPDLQLGYSISNNSINAVLSVIDDCLENDNFDIPDYIPNQMLLEEIMNTCLSLKSANNPENDADIQKLMKLYQAAQMKNIDAQTSAELAASNQLAMEVNEDLADPNGQINSQINTAVQSAEQATQGDLNDSENQTVPQQQ